MKNLVKISITLYLILDFSIAVADSLSCMEKAKGVKAIADFFTNAREQCINDFYESEKKRIDFRIKEIAPKRDDALKELKSYAYKYEPGILYCTHPSDQVRTKLCNKAKEKFDRWNDEMSSLAGWNESFKRLPEDKKTWFAKQNEFQKQIKNFKCPEKMTKQIIEPEMPVELKLKYYRCFVF